MAKQKVGILHPGQMGAVVAETIRNSGHEVWWASEGRGAETRARAEAAGLVDAGTVAALCGSCAALVSVCPPEFAEGVAEAAAGCGFRGLYVDLNAIAPERARRLARRIETGGGSFLDGSIIGMPARTRGQTWVYVSGENAAAAAQYFCGGPLEFEVLGDYAGQASALKMCFAAHSKGMAALQAAVLAAAEGLGVQDALARQWGRSGPNFERVTASIRTAAPKAWRFTAEMREIAETFAEAGVPKGFPSAAEEIYERLAEFKGQDPQVEEVLRRLRRRK